MPLFSALSSRGAISLVPTLRMIDRVIDRDRNYPQNLNISLGVPKLCHANTKTSARFAAIAPMTTKLPGLFRKIYTYVPPNFGACALRSATQKVAVANFSSIAFKILIKATIPMPPRVTIFMPLGAIAAITTIDTVAIHLSHARYQPLLPSTSTLKRPPWALQPIAYMHACVYAVRNISSNRNIHPHIYSPTMCCSIFSVHLVACK